jgi:hypothetical protein
MLVGSTLLIAAKLQASALGAGSSPLAVLSAVAVLGLVSLGAPVHVGDIGVSVLPLGALAIICGAIAWAAAKSARRAEAARIEDGARLGAMVGLLFAALCWMSALVFRFEGNVPVAVDGLRAAAMGLVWGVAFGAAGGATAVQAPSALLRRAGSWVSRRSSIAHGGVRTAAAMVVRAALATGVVLVVWCVATRLGGASNPLDALGRVVHLIAFAPNAAVTSFALSVGAPVEAGVGAGLAAGDNTLASYSISDWGAGPAPWYVLVLLLIPALSCFWGAMAARHKLPEERDWRGVIGIAALVFATLVAALAWLGEIRVGAALLESKDAGFARVRVEPGATFVFSLIWSAMAGGVGWAAAGKRESAKLRPNRSSGRETAANRG